MSDSRNHIKRLSDIQLAMKVPKDAVNDFKKYKYRTAGAIIHEAKRHMEPGESVVCDITPVEIAGLVYQRTVATFIHPDGTVVAEYSAREDTGEQYKGNDAPQNSGVARTYSKKGALENLFFLDDSKDDPDATNRHDKGDAAPAPDPEP